MIFLPRRNLNQARQILVRYMSESVCKGKTGGKVEKPSAGFLKLKENQKKFGADDGVPVWLKNGAKDKILFQFTLLLFFTGLAGTLHTFYLLIIKK